MNKGLYKAFNIESKAETSVFFFIIQSVFLGTFLGAFDVGATTLFLEAYDASMLPSAFTISGIAGIIMTTIYTWLQSKIKFSSLAVANLIAIAVLTGLLRLGYLYTSEKWLPFVILVMMGPLNIIALLGFWGTVGRMFTLRQGKRLFGSIDTGQILGVILISYAIPVVLSFGFQTKDTLMISAVSIVLALIFQIIITSKYKFKDTAEEKSTETETKKKSSFIDLFRNRYTSMMAIFVALSMLAAFFISFSFLSVLDDQYPDPTEFGVFFGAFTGTMMIFTIIIKTFVYSKLMKTYGLKISLIISPALVLFFTLIAAIIGSFFGYTSVSATFMFFFLLVLLSRLFSRALKDAIEAPSFKILYQSLDSNIRYDVQARVDGTVNEFAVVVSGLLLAGLGMIQFFKLIHFSYFLLIILAVWTIIAARLYKEYKRSLNKSLVDYSSSEKDEKEALADKNAFLKKGIKEGSSEKVVYTLKVSENIAPYLFEELLKEEIKNPNEKVRNYVLKKIDSLNLYSASDFVKKQIKSEKSKGIKEIAKNISDRFDKELTISFDENKLLSLAKSKKTDERAFVANIIGEFKEKKHLPILLALLRDIEPNVKIAAIKTSSKLQNPELCPFIAEALSSPYLFSYAFDAMVKMGEMALDSLELTFNKSGIDDRTLVRIVRIMGLIGGEKAIHILVNKINHHNRDVAYQVATSLNLCNYQANEETVNKINQAITLNISIIAWNLAAQLSFKEVEETSQQLEKAFEEELKSNFDLLFLLLSLAYDPKSIQHVRENLESGTSEGIGFGIELLDLFVADELKPLLFPILEDTSIADKVKQLQNEFPIDKAELEELLLSIINRDYNFINTWTKACALNSYSELEKPKVSDDLLAQLFNPDPILRESSACLINKIDKDAYNNCGSRLNEKAKFELDNIIKLTEEKTSHLLTEKVFYLENIKCFSGIPGNILYKIAGVIEDITITKGENISLQDSDIESPVLFIVEGSVELKNEKQLIKLAKNEFFDCLQLSDFDPESLSILANENSTVYMVNRELLNEQMFDFSEIPNTLVTNIECVLEK